jgi:effector-binding domain-containing protein
MKTIRRIIFIVLFLIAAFILSGFFLSRTITISVSQQIKSSPYKVYEQIYDLTNWNNWCIWLKDSTLSELGLEKTNSATLNQISFYNPHLGNCAIKTTNYKPFDSLSFITEFNKFGNATIKFTFGKQDSVTRLLCTFNSDLGNNPMNRWISLYYRQKLITDLESNLSNLSYIIDKQKNNSIIPFEEHFSQRFMLYDTITISASQSITMIPEMYSKIGKYLKKNKIKISGHPAICSSNLNDTMRFIKAGFIVDTLANIRYIHPLIPVKAVVAKYSGSYNGIAAAYKEIEKYIFLKQLTFNGEIWEEYLNDPFVETDSSKWQTLIYYTVKE